MLSHPDLVVCVPVYNEAAYLYETLRSLRDQTWARFAVLMADNASDDGTSDICNEFALNDSRFKHYRHVSNIGAAANFQFAARSTDSEYVMWLGGHDIIQPQFLELNLDALKQDPRLSLSYSYVRFIDDFGSEIRKVCDDRITHILNHPVARFILSIQYMTHCREVNGVIRRRFLDDIEIRPVVGSDQVILAHLLFRGPFHCVQDDLYYARLKSERRTNEAYMKRLTGFDNTSVNYNDLLDFYMDDLKFLLHRHPLSFLYRRLALSVFQHCLSPENGDFISRIIGQMAKLRRRLGFVSG